MMKPVPKHWNDYQSTTQAYTDSARKLCWCNLPLVNIIQPNLARSRRAKAEWHIFSWGWFVKLTGFLIDLVLALVSSHATWNCLAQFHSFLVPEWLGEWLPSLPCRIGCYAQLGALCGCTRREGGGGKVGYEGGLKMKMKSKRVKRMTWTGGLRRELRGIRGRRAPTSCKAPVPGFHLLRVWWKQNGFVRQLDAAFAGLKTSLLM